MNIFTPAEGAYEDQTKIAHLAAACGVPPTLAQILYLRGHRTEEQMKAFLHPSENDLHSPFALKDMDKAARRVGEALEKNEKILVYGDYDADGVSSTALLVRYFRTRGSEALYRIPDRMSEGYGMSEDALREIAEEGVSLIVTVDTGCAAANEIALARELGMDVVVTDHHECKGELPECCAVVDPMRPDCPYPFKGLAGVGVAYKLVCALESRRTPEKSENAVGAEILEQYGDLVAIGTVADVMPLTNENRYIVKKGLTILNDRPSPGLAALLGLTRNGKKEIDASFIGFNIAPRVNAAANVALTLFLSEDEKNAGVYAKQLSDFNDLRRQEERKIASEAFSMLANGDFDDDPVIVLCKEGWHKGVLGIVASRIVDACKKPVFLLASENGECCGSGRGVEGYNLASLLSENAGLLTKCGGHEAAAGLTLPLENLDAFRRAVNQSAREAYAQAPEESDVTAEMALSPFELTLPFAESLSLLEPCGSGNPSPQFVIYEMTVADVIALSDGKHSKPILEKEGLRFTSLVFGSAPESLPVAPGDVSDILFEISVDEYNGRRSIQLFPKCFCLSGNDGVKERREERIYESILADPASADPAYVPDREDFSIVYRKLRALSDRGIKSVSLRRLASDCFYSKDTVLPRLVMDVFKEVGLVALSRVNDEKIYRFSLCENGGKTDLFSSPLLRSLTGKQT